MKTSTLMAAFAAFVFAAPGVGAAAPNKCVVNGTVTYQREPCPSDQIRRQPTLQELNAEEKRRRAAAAPAPAPAPAAAAATPNPVAPVTPNPATAPNPPSASIAPTQSGSFRCDGRQHCSQMTSCAEAKYFLAHCPGVKMDGDKNGIPCEKQWCER